MRGGVVVGGLMRGGLEMGGLVMGGLIRGGLMRGGFVGGGLLRFPGNPSACLLCGPNETDKLPHNRRKHFVISQTVLQP